MKLFSTHKKIGSDLLPVLLSYFFLVFLYALFSFSLTDPNLVLLTWGPYQSFQTFMWQTFFQNAQLLTGSFAVLTVTLFITYCILVTRLKRYNEDISQSTFPQVLKIFMLFLLIISPLIFSYNALSHDVFNYLFNAKMVLTYQSNPHVQVALDFPNDPWIRFMHNTHTTAPYGYGWTILSLFPSLFGFGKFLSTWLAFRFFSLLSILGLLISLIFLAKKIKKPLKLQQLATIFLNPLFLIEIVSNSHNDLWMMIPAILSLALASNTKITRPNTIRTLISLALLLLSISIKFATIALIPVWFILIAENNLLFENIENHIKHPLIKRGIVFASSIVSKLLNSWWPLFASILLFLPLLTSQSKQFLPWYLLWSLIWIPFISWKPWKMLLLLFSISSLLRYTPWLWAGNFETPVELQQKLITWIIPSLYILASLIKRATSSHTGMGAMPLKAKTIE